MHQTDAHILLAEDDPTLQYLVHRQLKELGYQNLEVAPNGLIAVNKTLEKQYNIIFMDVMMPVLDGLLATRQIREAEVGRTPVRTPIIGMTAYADQQKCIQAGMDHFLLKPVMLRGLESALNTFLVPGFDEPKPVAAAPSPLVCVDYSVFQKTEEKLDEINSRIEELRRRYGLE